MVVLSILETMKKNIIWAFVIMIVKGINTSRIKGNKEVFPGLLFSTLTIEYRKTDRWSTPPYKKSTVFFILIFKKRSSFMPYKNARSAPFGEGTGRTSACPRAAQADRRVPWRKSEYEKAVRGIRHLGTNPCRDLCPEQDCPEALQRLSSIKSKIDTVRSFH